MCQGKMICCCEMYLISYIQITIFKHNMNLAWRVSVFKMFQWMRNKRSSEWSGYLPWIAWKRIWKCILSFASNEEVFKIYTCTHTACEWLRGKDILSKQYNKHLSTTMNQVTLVILWCYLKYHSIYILLFTLMYTLLLGWATFFFFLRMH